MNGLVQQAASLFGNENLEPQCDPSIACTVG